MGAPDWVDVFPIFQMLIFQPAMLGNPREYKPLSSKYLLNPFGIWWAEPGLWLKVDSAGNFRKTETLWRCSNAVGHMADMTASRWLTIAQQKRYEQSVEAPFPKLRLKTEPQSWKSTWRVANTRRPLRP